MSTAEPPDWTPSSVDPSVPSAARVYDYCIGGLHNFEVDRDFVRRGSKLWPELPSVLRANRAFLRRAVTHLCDAGIRQFLDIGSGIPTAGNVHEIAQRNDPAAKVAYVDIDPVAVAMSRHLLRDNPNAVAVQADFRAVESILDNPQIADLLDFTKPIAVLLVAILHYIRDDADPAATIARIRAVLPAGSYLALSHFSSDGPTETVAAIATMTRETPTPLQLRTREHIATFLDGFELLEPGLVDLDDWRPEDGAPAHSSRFNDYAAVARLAAGSG